MSERDDSRVASAGSPDFPPRPLVRIFISSPSDVRPERMIALSVIEGLARDFAYHFRVEPVLWEREPLLASSHFQDLILPPREADIVVTILWSRLGEPLPPATYRGAISDKAPVTGTEWEFEDALAGFRSRALPKLLLYHKKPPVTKSIGDRAEVEEALDQQELVDDFMRRWTRADDGKAFVAALWEFTTGSEFRDQLEEHLRALLRRRLNALNDVETPATITWYKGSPYRGLEPFELEHAAVFFGRRRAQTELREALAKQVAAGRGFVLVLGASGSGKSSLVKAGLLPDLLRPGMIGNVALCRYALTRPGEAAGEMPAGLADALLSPSALPELAESPLGYSRDDLARLLTEAPDHMVLPLRQGLAAASRSTGLTERGESRLVLVVDQLEELFTTTDVTDAHRRAYVSALAALSGSGMVWIVTTLRSDFYERLAGDPGLAALAAGDACYLLLPPDGAEIGDMIRRPGREAGLFFEVDENGNRALDEEIREAASADPASLPLLEYLLDQLWHRCRHDGRITFAAYDELGGLRKAIGARADAVLAELPDEVQSALPAVLRALVTVGAEERASPTARWVPLSAFSETSPQRRVIDALLHPTARILVADGDESMARVRVAHEALLTHWPRARDQIARDRRDLQARTRLEAAEERWRVADGKEKDSLLLPPGLPLSEGEALVSRLGGELASSLREYVAVSGAAARATERRRIRRLQFTAATLAMLTAIAAAGTYYAFHEADLADQHQKNAEENAREADKQRDQALNRLSESLGKLSRQALDEGSPEKAKLLALEGLPDEVHDRRGAVTTSALTALTLAQTDDNVPLWVSEGKAASFSPDGKRVVVAARDRTARVLDARTGEALLVLRGHDFNVSAAAFSPDGSRIATGSGDGTARLWNAQDGKTIAILEGHDDIVGAVDFSPDGNTLATLPFGLEPRMKAAILGFSANPDNTLRLWNARSGTPLAAIRHDAQIVSDNFSPDGARIVTVSGNVAHIWDTRNGDTVATLAHRSPTVYATYSPDGARIITTSGKAVWVWDARSGENLATIPHDENVLLASFSSDGKKIVTTSGSQARIWDARGKENPIALKGHLSDVVLAAFSPDGTKIVTTSLDSTVRVWNAKTGGGLRVIRGVNSSNSLPAFSPDGTKLLVVSNAISAEGSVQLWDLADKSEGGVASGDAGWPLMPDRSPDGTMIAQGTGSSVKAVTAIVRDARTKTIIASLKGHIGVVQNAIFSPDGLKVITTSMQNELAEVWEARSGKGLAILKGHTKSLFSVAFSPDSKRIVTASLDGTARVWDAESGGMFVLLAGHGGAVDSAAFSSDGARIVTTSRGDGTFRVWDSHTGANIKVFNLGEGSSDVQTDAAFSPDGSQIVTLRDAPTEWGRWASIRVWDIDGGFSVMVNTGRAPISARRAVFAPDGRRIRVLNDHLDTVEYANPLAMRIPDTILLASLSAYRSLTPKEKDEASIAEPAPIEMGNAGNDARCDRLAAHPDDPRRKGSGIPYDALDSDAAIASCEKAAAAAPGETRFQFQLGRALEKAGKNDLALAAFRKAAAANYPAAIFAVGRFQASAGAARDPVAALASFRRAYELGYPAAAGSVADFLLNGTGVEENHAEARTWAERGAASGGCLQCDLILGGLYELGDTVPKDPGKALFHHTRATKGYEDQGDEAQASAPRLRRAILARALPPAEALRAAREAIGSR